MALSRYALCHFPPVFPQGQSQFLSVANKSRPLLWPIFDNFEGGFKYFFQVCTFENTHAKYFYS